MAITDLADALKDPNPGYHPSKETTARFSGDMKLRVAGFAILARPDNGEPIWIRRGVKFRHSEALLRIKQEAVKK